MLFAAIQKQAQSILESVDANNLPSMDADVSQYSAQIAEHTDAKQLLYEQLVLGEIAAETYTAEKAVLDKRILQLQQAESASLMRIEQYKKMNQISGNIFIIAKKASEANTLTYPLVDLLIDKVHVLPGKNT